MAIFIWLMVKNKTLVRGRLTSRDTTEAVGTDTIYL